MSLQKKISSTKDIYNMDNIFEKKIIVILDSMDCFDKGYLNAIYMTKSEYLLKYPINKTYTNALMVENPIFIKKESLFESSNDNNISYTPKEELDNVWDILTKIKTSSSSNDTNIIENNVTTNTNNNSMNICKYCNEKDSFIENPYESIVVCLKCGMVSETVLDANPEWRQYNNDDTRHETNNRCGGPSNFFFPQSSQGTIISGYMNKHLQKKQNWLSMVYKERSLIKEFEFITQVCMSNGISKSIVDTTKIMYKKIRDCKHKTGKNAGSPIITRSDNRISVMANCVFKACETNREPRCAEDIAKMFGISKSRLTRGNKIFDSIVKNCDDSYIFEQLHASTPEDYISCHCKSLHISKQDTNLAIRISNNCCKLKLATNHNAQSIAAGSILTMIEYNNLDVDKKDIAKLSGTSCVIITSVYAKLMPYIDALVDDEITDHIIKKFKING